ncbi:flagellar basal body protein FliL [Roseovarius sp. TE539]|uniref:flagellar basal body-associated FliL family protein n=1 Tax=Roseovarius sp. TE539 TaxID=2249812 RepID=UPI000DDD36C8|nr:flagellar basal body-associated FliL family protein [Roseovarius sp. TE539]RBI71136.1 flagellar basal body protein FliL [Roseovarius sp. TE539]
MAEPEGTPGTLGAKKGKMPLVAGFVLALAGGGGGFYAAWAGLIPGLGATESPAQEALPGDDATAQDEIAPMPDIAYVPIEPLVISLGDGASGTHLRFRAQLEVPRAHEEEVTILMPRVVDVLNTYLRALETQDLSDSAALMRLRAHMLRRVQIVTGRGRVRDLLIMEFVLN